MPTWLASNMSTREAINTVRHLEKYPGGDFDSALGNVFDFDAFDESELRAQLESLSDLFEIAPLQSVDV